MAETPRLEARLFTTDGRVVIVPEVPAPPPAAGGRINVSVPYPEGEEPRTVSQVAILNVVTRMVMAANITPVRVAPGETLTVEFGPENAGGGLAELAELFGHARPRPLFPDGYGFAARVTLAFDGGNHPMKGDLWKCGRCAAVVFPGEYQAHDRDHATSDAVRANLASLNELMAEVTARVASDDPSFVLLVREVLQNHSHAVGFEFQGDGGGEPL